MTQEVEITPEELAELFCELDGDMQARVLNKIAGTFHSWGETGEQTQIQAIMHSRDLRYGKLWIEQMYENSVKE